MGKNPKIFFSLFFILAISFFLRFWKLSSIPPGLYFDEAINGNEAFLNPGKIFYPENNGREGLFINLVSLSFSIFGISIFALRMVSAIFGTLTVLGLYLLTKEIFSFKPEIVQKIALLSSFFLAISFWHLNFSRIAFRAILLPFFLVFSFYFLLKGLREKKTLNFIFSGIFFGLGFYSYPSFRMAILILPFVFIPYWFFYESKGEQRRFKIFLFCFFFFAFLIALPIGIYFILNPQYFFERLAPISIFSAENPLKEFLKSSILHLGMFNFYGDSNWRHNFSKSPQLLFPVGIFFLIGLIFSLKEILRQKDLAIMANFSLLFFWFLIMLLPGILTREGIPHALRTIGTLPPVFIFSGLGAFLIYDFLKKKSGLKFCFFILLFLIFVFEFQKYFIFWANQKEVKAEFVQNYLKMGEYLNSLPKDFEKYVIVNVPGVKVSWAKTPMPAQTIIFAEIAKYKKIRSNYILPENLNEIKIEKRGTILPMAFDQNLFESLKAKFPQGKIKKINDFFAYEIE